ncbi:acyl-CoA dehydrogenase [Georgenia sp. Z1491]|uniref:acyl-CoA dehydrogenase family protein n=1 Tax=Georgenia sp. Z1491 TaxID=3416707 RepID=UPI003CF1A59D
MTQTPIRPTHDSPTTTPSAHTPASVQRADTRIDGAEITRLLGGRWWHLRSAARDLALDPRMRKIEGLTHHEHRERVLTQLHLLTEIGDPLRAFPARLGGQDDHGGSLASFEELVVADPSLQIKAGVQWGLFASAILHLGTAEQHDRFLPGAMDLSVPGAFAMTERGHGSDVSGVLTTATYDPDTDEIVVHTPVEAAQKEYLGNAALHGKAAVVFAQLIVDGVNHGVHAMYVPVREERPDGSLVLLPGVGSADDGVKGGLNGIDNGRLWFDHVRIPRVNLLPRYGAIAADGTYSSPIESPGRRFFTMLSTLVQGRVSLSNAATGSARMALAIAVTHAEQRRQFTGGDPQEEVVLLDYQRHQRRLLPRIARTYALTFLGAELLERFDDVFSGRHDTDEDRQDLETLAAATKPLATWNALDTIQEAREACGGAGYMAENRLTGLHADLDVYATFEGDNNVLLQLVGKRLLTDAGKEMMQMDVAGTVRWVAARAADTALHRTPLRRAAQSIRDSGSKARSAGHLRSADVQRELLEERVETMVEEIVMGMRSARGMSDEKAFEVFNSHQDRIIAAARAHGELLAWEAFTDALSRVRDKETFEVLRTVRDLYGLTVIEDDLAWYLVNGRMTAQRAKTVTSYVERLLARLRPHAKALVDAFGYSPEHLGAPIAGPGEAERQQETREYQRRLRASGEAPVDEKTLRAQAKQESQDARAEQPGAPA